MKKSRHQRRRIKQSQYTGPKLRDGIWRTTGIGSLIATSVASDDDAARGSVNETILVEHADDLRHATLTLEFPASNYHADALAWCLRKHKKTVRCGKNMGVEFNGLHFVDSCGRKTLPSSGVDGVSAITLHGIPENLDQFIRFVRTESKLREFRFIETMRIESTGTNQFVPKEMP